MIGKKSLNDIRASLLDACSKAGIEPILSFDEKIRMLETRPAVNEVEIETLKLIRDGLTANRQSAKPARKKAKSKFSHRK